MHASAMQNGRRFFETYAPATGEIVVADIGAQDVNGSLKQVCPAHAKYIGVDFVAGKGVDVVLTDPYQLEFADESLDIVVSSSCFEHSEMFWLLFTEILRTLKPHGLLYLNAPSGGAFHRYPVDCWRFYPDSGNALVKWAKRCHLKPALLESYVSMHESKDNPWFWNDFVAVFVKDERHVDRYPRRITQSYGDFYNGLQYGVGEFLNHQTFPEDMRKVQAIGAIASGKAIVK